MTITELLRPIDVYCDVDGDMYYLYDSQDALDLGYDDGGWDFDGEDYESHGYYDIVEIVDRIEGIWYGWIVEDLQEEFGCTEDFQGDLNAVQAWMDANQDVIYPETYAWYSEIINSILNPQTIIDDAPRQD